MSNEVVLYINSDVKPRTDPISGLLPSQYLVTDMMILWLILLLVVFALLLLLLISGVVVFLSALFAMSNSEVLLVYIFSKNNRTFLLSQSLIFKIMQKKYAYPYDAFRSGLSYTMHHLLMLLLLLLLIATR